MVTLEVIDTGIGISDVFIAKLFEPFEQESTDTKRKYEGTGLGLSICKKYLELLGGTITVTSTLGKGSTFTVNIPEYAS